MRSEKTFMAYIKETFQIILKVFKGPMHEWEKFHDKNELYVYNVPQQSLNSLFTCSWDHSKSESSTEHGFDLNGL
jgi:hypothetical protein